MKRKLLKDCLRIASKALQNHPERSNFPHFTFVVQEKKVVEWATNSKHEPPIHFGYYRRDDPDFKPKLHSELWAWKKAKGILIKEPFEIINIRLNRDGEIKLSKPCKTCFNLLSSLGCKTFWYSSDCGFLRIDKPNK